MIPTEYRTKTNPPTEPGWYWAKEEGDYLDPSPARVFDDFGKLRVLRAGSGNDYPVFDFDWFGPVIMVKEG